MLFILFTLIPNILYNLSFDICCLSFPLCFIKTEKISIPVVDMLMSIPVWTIIITCFCGSWTNQAMFTNLPIYLKHVQGMDIELVR